MSGPRHLWSGDWELESSARRDALAAGRGRHEEPEQPAPAPGPPRRTLRERLGSFFARHRRRLRIAFTAVCLAVLVVGAAVAVTSALDGSGASGDQPPVAAAGSRAWLGIDVTTSPYGGVMVINVFPGSPAQAAGMEPGDVITRVNGHAVASPSDVTSAIAKAHPGDKLKLQFQGSGTTYSKSIPLSSPPAGYP
jgi:membrane-associated protease RseP (regulator of RpoE activity)